MKNTQFFYAADDWKRSKDLAKEIEANGWIDPLIVAVEKNEPYILEGVHRFVALHLLGLKSFPALIVVSEEDTVTSKLSNDRNNSGVPMSHLLQALRKLVRSSKEEEISRSFKGKNARDVPFEEYATKNSPFMILSKKFSQYDINEYVYKAIKNKESYQAMQKEISKAWRFHSKQSSTLHLLQAARLGNLLGMLYASHPDAPLEIMEDALRWAKSYRVEAAIGGDKIPGGLGDDVPYSEVDPEELRMGIEVEREHTGDDLDLAKEIAKDHLAGEDPQYYSKLKKAGL